MKIRVRFEGPFFEALTLHFGRAKENSPKALRFHSRQLLSLGIRKRYKQYRSPRSPIDFFPKSIAYGLLDVKVLRRDASAESKR